MCVEVAAGNWSSLGRSSVDPPSWRLAVASPHYITLHWRMEIASYHFSAPSPPGTTFSIYPYLCSEPKLLSPPKFLSPKRKGDPALPSLKGKVLSGEKVLLTSWRERWLPACPLSSIRVLIEIAWLCHASGKSETGKLALSPYPFPKPQHERKPRFSP